MTITIVCDHCGEPISGEHVVLRAEKDRAHFRRLWTVHYHAAGCWPAVFGDDDQAHQAAPAERSSKHDPFADDRERRRRWKATTPAEREALILQALGDDRLPIKALAKRVAALRDDLQVYDSDLRPVLLRMADAGELGREREPITTGPKFRWTFFRLTAPLDGPIAELEAVYNADEEASDADR